MEYAALLIAAALANAFGRRFAGGMLQQWIGPIGGTQVGRLVQAFIAGCTVAVTVLVLAPSGTQLDTLAAVTSGFALATVVLTWIGATAGFPTGMLPRSVKDVLGLCLHGLMAVTPLVLGLLAFGYISGTTGLVWWWLIGAGLLRGPFYALATLWTPHAPALGLINLRFQGGPMDPPAWAEFWSGGALGIALVLTVN
jgi:hypothetical protein